jgi:hypothetical protein
MQSYRNKFIEDDRRIARRWALGSIGFYGSILVGMILYTVFSKQPDAHPSPDESASNSFVAAMPREPASKMSRR